MKRQTRIKILLLVGLAAVISSCHPAYADEMFTKNQAGGELVLTDAPCPDQPKLSAAHTRLSTGKQLAGCWVIVNGAVHVMWKDGDQSVYPPEAFKHRATSKKEVSL